MCELLSYWVRTLQLASQKGSRKEAWKRRKNDNYPLPLYSVLKFSWMMRKLRHHEMQLWKSWFFPCGGTSLKASIPTKMSFQFSLSLNTPIINSLKDFKRPFDFKLMRIAKAEDSGNQRSTAIALKTHTQVCSVGGSNPSSPILLMCFAPGLYGATSRKGSISMPSQVHSQQKEATLAYAFCNADFETESFSTRQECKEYRGNVPAYSLCPLRWFQKASVLTACNHLRRCGGEGNGERHSWNISKLKKKWLHQCKIIYFIEIEDVHWTVPQSWKNEMHCFTVKVLEQILFSATLYETAQVP